MVRLLFLWCLLGAACPAVRSSDDVVLIGNAYSNVYVALSADLPEAQCEEVVTKLESVLKAASSLLYTASGRRVHFETDMKVVLPSTYTAGCGKYGGVELGVQEWDYGHAPIRVTPTHPLFGDTIWTQQPRGCEAPGDFITLTPASLDNVTLASRLFVGEWAKFRWGVMEEWGHYGDYVYPPAYEQEQGQFEPTICVDATVEYSTEGCTTAALCTPTPIDSNNTSPTSSLLSVPTMPNVVSFCTSDTHDKEAPTKQNVLCDGRSAMEVFMQHLDYTAEPLDQPEPPALSVRAFKEFTVPAFVVFAVQLNMRKYILQENYLLDALCQAVNNYLQDGVFFGYVYFNDTAYSLELQGQPLMQLNANTTKEICNNIWKLAQFETNTDINVTNAIAKASELLPAEGGAVILVAEPDAASDTEDVAQAVAAAGGNSVWPVLYPVDEEDTQWFESLSALTGGGGVQTVQLIQSPGDNKLLLVVRQGLSDALLAVVSSVQSTQLELKSSTSCTIEASGKCSMTLQIKNQAVTNYLISVYYSTIFMIEFIPEQPQCKPIIINVNRNPDYARTYACQTLPVSVEVRIVAGHPMQSASSEVVAVVEEKPLSEATLLSVWASTGIRDLKYTNSTAPALFVQVLLEGRQVLDSAVGLMVHDATQEMESSALVTLSPKDNGIGADTTGNDGIYSTYLTGLPSNFSLSALTFTVSASSPAKLMPATMTLEEPIQCCGSSLPLPSDLNDAGMFLLTTVVRAKVTAPPTSNLPPGRVTDLRATTSSGRVALFFTAPGADLYYGTVSKYIVTISNASGSAVASRSFTEGLLSEGQVQTLYIAENIVECNVLQTYAVESYDEKNLGGGLSNVARHTISCSTVNPMAAGALLGIIIGALLLFIILWLIIYIGCNWKRRDELAAWKALTCRLCKKGKKKNAKGKPIPIPTKSKNRPRADADMSNDVEVIRNIGDLYSKPNIVLKHKSRNVARAGDRPARAGFDNAGFDDGGRPRHAAAVVAISTASRPMTSASSRRSSGSSSSLKNDNMPYDLKDSTLQTTLPINNVGIPVVQRRAPPPSSQDSSFDNLNAFSIYPREESEDFFVGQNYPPSYSVNPDRVLDTFPSNAYGSSASSPSTSGKPRLNSAV